MLRETILEGKYVNEHSGGGGGVTDDPISAPLFTYVGAFIPRAYMYVSPTMICFEGRAPPLD